MTAKRFELAYEKGNWWAVRDGDITLWKEEVIYLLNKLHSRNKRLEEKIQRERASFTKTHERWSKEAETKIKELSEENEELKKVLGAILLEVKQDISNTNQTGEIRVFINPNSFNLISKVLRKYGALKEW